MCFVSTKYKYGRSTLLYIELSTTIKKQKQAPET